MPPPDDYFIIFKPQQNPLGYLSAAFSFPPWLVKRWLTRFSPTELIPLLFWWNTPAPLTLRVNPLRGTPAAYRERLAEAPATAELLLPAEQSPSGDFPETIRLTGSCPISLLPGFDEGALSIQDASAQYPARWLAPQPGERIWDVCAAPGGKTTHLAELQKDQGQIVASDVQADRLGLIEDNVQRLGLRSITTAVLSRELDHAPHSDFDAALIDVPCSNTGVLGKRPEARWRLKPADLVELPDLQRQILKLALTNIRAGGRAVYSTCSIEPEENRGLVQRVLQELPEWSLIREHDHLPGQPGDGGYLALLQRAEATG